MMNRRLLFRREFLEYTGGHGKVFDYFRHTGAHSEWQPLVHVTANSTWEQNPWAGMRAQLSRHYDPRQADALFIGGMDWLAYPDDLAGKPVVNLIQHVRHATPGHPLRQYLHRPAIRICVSQAVADAIRATGRVRGPVHVIEAALDLPAVESREKIPASVFVDAIKQPALGLELTNALALERGVSLITRRIPRAEYLERLAQADVAILLPNPSEGFYLPALEAMAMGCAVVVPDCIGNRAYARDGVNAMMPALDTGAILLAVRVLLKDASLRDMLRAAGIETSHAFGQADERSAFHRLLDQIDAVWSSV